jgi:hypothetical protein
VPYRTVADYATDKFGYEETAIRHYLQELVDDDLLTLRRTTTRSFYSTPKGDA